MRGKGFTLVELLIVIVILSVATTILGTSFRTGLAAYARVEADLTEKKEGDVLLYQLEQELRNALPYFKYPFEGKRNSIEFPAHLRRFTPKGVEEALVVIEYKVTNRTLVRTERKIKKGIRERFETKETLLGDLDTFRFQFLNVDESDELIWTDEWPNDPYIGIPRGVRVTVSGSIFGETEWSRDILMPHGVLVKA